MLLLRLPLGLVYFCLGFALLAPSTVARADAVVIRFRPSSGAAGYKVYSAPQTTGAINATPLDAGARSADSSGTASYSLSGLDPTRAYSVELTAYDSKGKESARSNRLDVGPRTETLGAVLWSSSFDVYAPGVHVPDFVDSLGDTVTSTGTNLFSVAYLSDGSRTYGTQASAGAVSSRWVGAAGNGAGSYELSGRLRPGGLNAQSGLAVRVTGAGAYFALAQGSGGAWSLRGVNEPALTCGPGPALGVSQPSGSWYSFKLRVTRAAGLSRVRAKVWLQGAAEPSWQADCWTTVRSLSDSGSFALQRGYAGSLFFDDLRLMSVVGTLEAIPPR